LHTQVEVLLDQHLAHVAVAHGQAGDGVGLRVGGDGLQLMQDGLQAVIGVLAVDQQPVEAGAGGDFGHRGVGQVEPEADLAALVLQRLLEGVDGGLHGVQVNWNCSVPSGP
jgi:hypothetical protein